MKALTIGTPEGTDWNLPPEYVARRDRLNDEHAKGLMTEWEWITRLTDLWIEFHGQQ